MPSLSQACGMIWSTVPGHRFQASSFYHLGNSMSNPIYALKTLFFIKGINTLFLNYRDFYCLNLWTLTHISDRNSIPKCYFKSLNKVISTLCQQQLYILELPPPPQSYSRHVSSLFSPLIKGQCQHSSEWPAENCQANHILNHWSVHLPKTVSPWKLI